MLQSFENIVTTQEKIEVSNDLAILDYSTIFDQLNVEYIRIGYYLQVGEIAQTEGWILHLSIVRSQIPAVLRLLVPRLIDAKVPFRLPKDKETARNILDGNLGSEQVGKVISVFPTTTMQAKILAKDLIRLTPTFKGPVVLTDIHLGSILYTRYGSFGNITKTDDAGKEANLMYKDGELIEDIPTIPFQLPAGITWPFDEFANPIPKPRHKIINQIYRPVINLKTDPRGNVIKSLYLARPIWLKWCVLKQGIKNMWSDDFGRDIPDRLLWQRQLHTELKGKLPIPAILDFFDDHDDTYLVMEYINGKSIFERHLRLNIQCSSWNNYTHKDQILLLTYLLQIIDLINVLHKEGIIHRDITPVNFLIDKEGKLHLIDIELAYSFKHKAPVPPYGLGTNGFMSPEQVGGFIPSTAEDIYGLGATMAYLFTGLPPITFENQQKQLLYDNLSFFIENSPLSKLIVDCLDHDIICRPVLASIKNVLSAHLQKIKQGPSTIPKQRQILIPTKDEIRALIQGAIIGLKDFPTSNDNGLWLSLGRQKELMTGKKNKQLQVSIDFAGGITGVLYFLSFAKRQGFQIDSCSLVFKRNWAYLYNKYLTNFRDFPPGLYFGAAGMGLAFSEAIHARLIENTSETQALLIRCLNLPNSDLNLANGLAGQGITALTCTSILEQSKIDEFLQEYLHLILSRQKNDGSWVHFYDSRGKSKSALSFSHGNTGIIWFLLTYFEQKRDVKISKAILQALRMPLKEAKPLKSYLTKNGVRTIIAGAPIYLDGLKGFCFVFMKAYELFGTAVYRQAVEDILFQFPEHLVHDNFNQDNGLSCLGEIYLEAYRLFKTEVWLRRATWITEIFLHTALESAPGVFYWQGNNLPIPLASLMTGNSGIIQFLIKYYKTL
jgi:serine/threonine protein kinase